MQTEQRIRSWLMQYPGLVVSYSPQAVLREALKMFCKQTSSACELPAFTDALWRAGYRPDQRGADWVLTLPEEPHSSDSHYRRLRNIVG